MRKPFYQIIVMALLLALVTWAPAPSSSREQAPYRVLISGFGPFGSNPQNPTGEMAAGYATPALVEGVLVKGVELPVVYFEAWEKLEPVIESFNPDFIIAFGLDASAAGVRFERVAKNEDRGYADNDGVKHQGVIVEGGAAKIKSDLPVDALALKMLKHKVPAYVSGDAGGYLCNHVFYQVMHYSVARSEVSGAFVHMPNWPVDGDSPKTQINVLKILVKEMRTRSEKKAKERRR